MNDNNNNNNRKHSIFATASPGRARGPGAKVCSLIHATHR